jgi:hypothetical protein
MVRFNLHLRGIAWHGVDGFCKWLVSKLFISVEEIIREEEGRCSLIAGEDEAKGASREARRNCVVRGHLLAYSDLATGVCTHAGYHFLSQWRYQRAREAVVP